jgi:hypothetical protein
MEKALKVGLLKEKEKIKNIKLREIIHFLAQNEFAYVLDTNNGRVNVVVGPTKETLTTTEQPMRYRGLPRKPRGLALWSVTVRINFNWKLGSFGNLCWRFL